MTQQIPLGRIGCAGVVIKDKKILLLKRRSDATRCPDKWTLPAGGIEPTDASLEACVVREVKEEAGLNFVPTKKFKFYQSLPEDGKRNISLVFLGDWSGNLRIQLEEVSAGDFFSYDEFKKLKMAFAYGEVVEDLKLAGYIN